MRVRSIGAAVTLGVAALAGTASPAHAAYPTSSFYVKYGNSYAKGTVTWYRTSARVDVVTHAASGCRNVHVVAWSPRDENANSDVCASGTSTRSDVMKLYESNPGGYTGIIIYLHDGNTPLAADICRNGDEYCTNY